MANVLALLLCALSCAYGHSWVACTDYSIGSTGDAQYYNPRLCQGYTRGWAASSCERTNTQFGLDCGSNYQPGGGPVCKMPQRGPNYAQSYTPLSPMASYSPGERVCLAWPTKNHVAASCANRFIPDHGTKLYMSGPNPTADPASLASLRQMTLVKDFGTNTAADSYVGFQNCPKFCENNDKALCTGCFTLPANLRIGATYSFYWTWAFNSATDVFTSCWEAKIVQGSGIAAINETADFPPPSQVGTSLPEVTQPAFTEQPANSGAPDDFFHFVWPFLFAFLAK